VGAVFFIVALTTGLFVGIFASNGFTRVGAALPEEVQLTGTQELLGGAGWIALALFLGLLLMWISFEIAHRIMGVENNETTFRYIQRELVEEHNAALALFLGGLAVVPFIAVIFQTI
jgi:hypothetical protein